MKLRIRDNSIRLRLTRGEVEALARDGRVAAVIAFPGGARLEYAVESTAGAPAPGADYAASCIRITVPAGAVHGWAGSDAVSIAGQQSLGGEATLAILVEKDFACLAPRVGEDESDMFPHPGKDIESC